MTNPCHNAIAFSVRSHGASDLGRRGGPLLCRWLTALLLGLALGSGCSRPTSAPGAGDLPGAVAQVGDRVITVDQLQRKLEERSRRHPALAWTPADREAALEELVQFEVLWAEAQRAGWHTNAELIAGFQRSVVGRFKEQQVARLRTAPPTEAEIAAFYEQHLARFTTATKWRGAVLLVESPQKATVEKRAEAAQKAAELREQAVNEALRATHFGSLAQRYSIDQATRYAGGDFGLLTAAEIEGRYGATLTKALQALPAPGEISPVVETPRGLGFVRLIERKPATSRTLAQVRDGIVHELTQAKQAQAERDFLAASRSRVEMRINRALLNSIPLAAPNEEPPALPTAQIHSRKDPL